MKQKTYNVQGTHCRSCELLLEDRIGQVQGVKKVEANYRTGRVRVSYDDKVQIDSKVDAAVRSAGYRIGTGQAPSFFSGDPLVYFQLLFASVLLLILYIGFKLSGLSGFNPGLSASPGMALVFLVGLVAGTSTCMALIGGLVLSISARHAELHPEATLRQKFRPHLYFNLGRIISFVLLGGLIGAAGAAFRLSSVSLGWLTVLVGGVMLFLGLKLTELSPRLSAGGFALPKAISRFFGAGKQTQEYSHRSALVSGALTFFLPCGFTQAMQVYAIGTGSFAQGALIMGLFALGTVPGLIGIGALTSAVRGWFAQFFFKFVAVAVIALAVFNISNGLNLTGVPVAEKIGNVLNRPPQAQGTVAPIENGKQVVRITQLASAYEPNNITVKKSIPVRLIVTGTTQYSCSASFVIPSLKIYQALQIGENEFEFTPTETGPMRFSCSMGMYGGVINVID